LNGFYDNSINHLEPGESKMVPFLHTLAGDLVNNIVVSATPVHPDGTPIKNLDVIKATDSSEIIDVIARTRKLQLDNVLEYASPVAGTGNCIQTQWEDSGNAGELVCASRDVYISTLKAQEDSSCLAGYTKTVTIEASVIIAMNTLFDLGWYIDTAPGGDAMQGSECIVNGLIEPNEYYIVNARNPSVPFGDVKWGTPTDTTDDDTTGATTDDQTFGGGAKLDSSKPSDRKKKRQKKNRVLFGDDDSPTDDASDFTSGDDAVGNGMDEGDGDECGDVYIHGEDEALIKIPIAVEVALSCDDANEDGNLDFPICFTWRHGGAAECTFGSNLPEDNTGGCYCTRYDVPNIEVLPGVITPPVNDTTTC
jgi:hypothetical protein